MLIHSDKLTSFMGFMLEKSFVKNRKTSHDRPSLKRPEESKNGVEGRGLPKGSATCVESPTRREAPEISGADWDGMPGLRLGRLKM